MHSEGKDRTRRALLRNAATLAGAAAVECLMPVRAHANSLRVGGPAPAAKLLTLGGERIATPDLIGRVVILTFWATWCVPCRAELPLLSDYASQHSAHGLSVLGFSLDASDQLPQVTQIARSLSFPNGLLMASSAPGYGRIWKIPVNFTIDRNGRLIDDGWKDKQPAWTPDRLERVVMPLLRSSQ